MDQPGGKLKPATSLLHDAKDNRVLAPNRFQSDSEIRSIFISDVHLGCRFSRAEPLLRFLDKYNPDHLFLVGDFIDGWCLARKWYWPPAYDAVVRRLLAMANNGTQIFYTPGNHDEFLRKFHFDQPLVQIQDEFIHECADGRRLVILHGDQFDDVEKSSRWLSKFGAVLYDGMLCFDRRLNDTLAKFCDVRIPVSRFLKQSVKKVVQFVSGFEGRVAAHVRERGCDGAVCGHIHVPKHKMLGDVLYVNLGDWMENCTALVEYADGRLELLNLEAELLTREARQHARALVQRHCELAPVNAVSGVVSTLDILKGRMRETA